ncbi:MAG: EAL domain-containing protein [Sulfuricurvum sp.]|uniref:EAL domain-containing protein n=1 Tax=Sulfuricurvum sp. TaxID=2025608 RepID=UPI0025F5A002|nr:EAL domain-containing protein [Sulfuricurvum sp.]MBV5320682.1 EAL domain-containing protein [Sulfuricurvum sp.]
MLNSLILLYVEDDESTISAFSNAFGDDFKTILIGRNGEEGLELFHKYSPHMIISDLQLPKMSGLDMIEEIRKTDSSIPIIVNSAFSDTNLLLRSIDLRVDSYVLKPTNPNQLLNVMHKVARINVLESLLKTSKETMQTIIDEIPDPILYIKPDYSVMMLNNAAKNLNPNIVNDESIKCYGLNYHLKHPCTEHDHVCPIKQVGITKKSITVRQIHILESGEKRHVEIHMRPIFDEEGEISAYLEISHDITDYIIIQDQLFSETQKLSHISMHDPLTQLPNRRLLNDRIEQTIQHKHRSKELFALFFIDLDHFKEVNDSMGHLSGDQLLIEVAKRITKVTRNGDTIARIGGDEFVLIIENGSDVTHFAHVAEKLKKLFETPFLIGGKKIFSACSIGISIYPNDGDNAEALLSNADAAMYASKESGRNKYHFYTPQMREEATTYLQAGNELKEGIKNNELILFYQPIIDSLTNQCLSFEALIRWNNPKKGLITPNDFLPTAHKAGLMIEIDEWVITTAIKTFSLLSPAFKEQGSVAINLTVETLLNESFVKFIENIVASYGLKPENLVLEIVETSLMSDIITAKRVISDLHALGVKIAIDDFGTGYSSLSYILELDIDILKIDQSFIRKIGVDERGPTLIKSIIALSKIIDVTIVAEGVETAEQKEFLVTQGANELQGYLFAKPMKQLDLIQFLPLK